MIIRQDEFKRLLFGDDSGKSIRYATIPSDYVDGRPQLIFDGESTKTIKRYPRLASYTPVAGDRVQVIGGVIQDKII